METLERIKRKIGTAESLHSVVTTMKSLASVNIRQYERAVESLKQYDRSVILALRALLMHGRARGESRAGKKPLRTVAVVFGSDQGMCGQLNEQIVGHAVSEIDAGGFDKESLDVVAAGERVAASLEYVGVDYVETVSMPSSADAITARAWDLIMILDRLNEEKGVGRVFLYYSMRTSGASYRQETVDMLPLSSAWLAEIAGEKWPTNNLPLITLETGRLLSALTRQYIFVSLYRAFAESLASENASRLAAMQGAEKNIEERRSELLAQYHQKRQMSITEELLDVVSGYDALRSKK